MFLKYWSDFSLLVYVVISILFISQAEFQMFYAFTVLTSILLVFITLDRFESFKLEALAAMLRDSIAEAKVSKQESDPLNQEFKQKTEGLEQLIKKNRAISIALSCLNLKNLLRFVFERCHIAFYL